MKFTLLFAVAIAFTRNYVAAVQGMRCRKQDLKWIDELTCEVPPNCIDLVLPDKEIGTYPGVAIFKALDEHPRIQRIYVQKNRLGPKAALALVETLEDLQSVEVVNLDNNNIGDEGAEAFATLLASNHPMSELSLNNNHISNIGARALVEALQYNTNLKTLFFFQNDDVSNGFEMKLSYSFLISDCEFLYVCRYLH